MAAAFADLRAQLVREISERGALHSRRVAAAFLAVPRHVFLPGVAPDEAYSDRSIPVKLEDGIPISSSSQPAMMAEMLEQLDVHEGERVLEIGAGSGYNAALLARLAGPTGSVTTIELDADLAAAARDHLDRAGFSRVRVICADGAAGDPAGAPFDALIASVGAGDVPAAWSAQLRTGGRLVMPLTLRGMQKVICFERAATSLASRSIIDGGFMMLRGRTTSVVGPAVALDASTSLRVLDPNAVDRRALDATLRAPTHDAAAIAPLTIDDLWLSFGWWLALHEDGFCRLTVSGPAALTTNIPDITGVNCTPAHAEATTLGVLAGDELAVFALHADGRIILRTFGWAPRALARLQDAIAAWNAAGRPQNDGLRVEIVPRGAAAHEPPPHRGEGAVTIALPSAFAIVRWNRG